ncbi:MAG TPA: hypothetical protein VGF94_04815 [Kofleriaceae bacterium]|jgi:hypothetical protein
MRSLLVLVLLTAPALADSKHEPKSKSAETKHSDDCAAARKAHQDCVLTFENNVIEGNSPTGGGTTVATLPTTKQPSLLPIRHDFIVEIIKSAEDL